MEEFKNDQVEGFLDDPLVAPLQAEGVAPIPEFNAVFTAAKHNVQEAEQEMAKAKKVSPT